MSVTMQLYKYDVMPCFSNDKRLGFIEWASSEESFDTIDYYPQEWKKTRTGRNMYKNLSKYHDKFVPTATTKSGEYHKELPVYEYLYAQGWFFTNKFFKRKFTNYYCTTKKEMINFFLKIY